jgi:acetyl-CoA carboxylase biotin carboxyl carrier protein
MTLEEIKRLIEFIRAQELTEFELEQDGVKLRIKSGTPPPHPPTFVQAMPVVAAPVAAAPLVASPPRTESTPGNSEAAPEEGSELAIVKSPIVGTFYRSPEPGAKSFVEIGDGIKKGQVLCIIEAMKLMNEIDSEYDGELVSIYVENGQAVQYGERLFAIKLRSN